MNDYKLKGILGDIQEAFEKGFIENRGTKPKNSSQIIEFIMDNLNIPYIEGHEAVCTYSDEIGEQCYAIFIWKGKYYKMPFNYRSHWGSEYNGNGLDVLEVVPKKEVVTVYESK